MRVVLKIENGETEFVHGGEFATFSPSPLFSVMNAQSYDAFLKYCFEVEPRKMADGSLSLPSEVHRVSGISNMKPEAKFTLKAVIVDFITLSIVVENEWSFHAKQWPNGFVRITKVK